MNEPQAFVRDRTGEADAQSLAERVRDAMFALDNTAQDLGIEVLDIGPGRSRLAMTVQPRMLNGFGICHGAYITAIADSAFAYACNACNEQTVASGIALDFLLPGRPGDRLTANAREIRASGRTGLYDIEVFNQHGELVAVMRGKSYRMKGRPVMQTE
ncbi:MAG TPA: hydroxyphenylacetyl-CoA thioesterase PaaI [Azoarcus taiwanensis]|uniref:Hydroxyphenylacetyl-CoA thioesterase PaaI n=1 Tax=Azoarcus taiwanensis TaxID=666964 RepID=A0A972FDR0_9RHOO|nr:hydroxyphenylacetyl-CoA thioesterase PaaI [Azoarcus taiwanensis]NMG02835.1 hydroxyphenylacetyl-CoA thioesterase PaaI [Azoarcus taiwanensis]HRQ55877.1 hydroxyphenylacetyl-CoA thioesterase PaaI [Azoarcus taiwanensis]